MLHNPVPSKEEFLKATIKRLFFFCAISVLFNCALLAISSYMWWHSGYFLLSRSSYAPKEHTAYPKEPPFSLSQEITALLQKDGNILVSLLDDKKSVGEGYTKRDLALAILITVHKVDIHRALADVPAGRYVTIGEKEILLFSGLNDEAFSSIKQFMAEEMYPYTIEGLFSMLKASPQNESLKNAFLRTEECAAFVASFSQKPALSKEECLQLILEGDWDLFSDSIESQKKAFDPSLEERYRILKKYLQQGSPTAATALIATEIQNTTKKTPEKKSSLKKEAPRGEILYVVQQGDSLWRIAQRYKADVEKIRSLNRLPSDSLQPGTQLQIPLQ